MNENNNLNEIDASPTKELFIDMLTKDIGLIPAICDLVDNATDGAQRLQGEKTWSGLNVNLELSKDEFIIYDNCGGMTVETARNYAFRFGRPSNTPSIKGEVGRFGVGMKRALFKIGRTFLITSTTKETDFSVRIDVDEWATDPGWHFTFEDTPTENGQFPEVKWGTQINVWDLHESVQNQFESDTFLNDLRLQIESKMRESIAKGMLITVNGIAVGSHPLQLISDAGLAPVKKELSLPGSSPKSKVKVRLFCGLGKSDIKKHSRKEAGWYIFCNGRLLLDADKTSLTVWGEEDESSIPAFHPQYNLFRGFAYFSADNVSDLPWNTTKTGVDTDSAIYRAVKLEMINLSRPVIDFLNKLKEERESYEDAGDDTEGPLRKLINKSKQSVVSKIKAREVFQTPEIKPVKKYKAGPPTTKIQYSREDSKIDILKKVLRVRSAKAVGEKTFDYVYKAECEDE